LLIAVLRLTSHKRVSGIQPEHRGQTSTCFCWGHAAACRPDVCLVRAQESRIVRVMRKQLVKRSLDMIKDISKRPAGESGRSDYDTFWEVNICFPSLGVHMTGNWSKEWVSSSSFVTRELRARCNAKSGLLVRPLH